MKANPLRPRHFVAILVASLGMTLGSQAWAAEKKQDDQEHEHEHGEGKAGPNGGRILHGVEPHLEFLVTKDRKVQITAVDDDYEPVAIGELSVRVAGGSRSNPTRMSFEKKGDVLVSDVAFPEGNGFPVVVQIKVSPDAKTVIEKFNLDLSDCPTCKFREYACICDHHDHDHDHKHEEAKKKKD